MNVWLIFSSTSWLYFFAAKNLCSRSSLTTPYVQSLLCFWFGYFEWRMASIENKDLSCSICYNVFENPRSFPCGHSFCGTPRPCVKRLISSRQNPLLECPYCKTPVQKENPTEEDFPLNEDLIEVIKVSKNDSPPTAWFDSVPPLILPFSTHNSKFFNQETLNSTVLIVKKNRTIFDYYGRNMSRAPQFGRELNWKKFISQ